MTQNHDGANGMRGAKASICPAVSVVVPVFNGAIYLRETIHALLNQSFVDFEIIVVDDGSTDESVPIATSFRDSRLRIIQQANKGLCDALNTGIREARASYVARNDQDDISYIDRLDKQFCVMERNPEAIALFTFKSKFGAKHRWSNHDKLRMVPGLVRSYEPLGDGCLLGSTMFARREHLIEIGGFRSPYYPVDDWDLELRLSQAGHVLVLCEALVAYRFQASANTYRVFREMQNKKRWTKDSYLRRSGGLAELEYDEFAKAEAQGLWAKFQRRRDHAAALSMRTAGQDYLDGRYPLAILKLIIAVLLSPIDLMRRLDRLWTAKFRAL